MPNSTDKTLRPIDLKGKFSPFHPSPAMGVPDQPVMIRLADMPGEHWVVVFSSLDDLHETMAFVGETDYKVKRVEGKEFAESILEHKIRIMLDPRIVNKEKTKWTEVMFS